MVIVTRIAVLALAVTGFGLVHAGAALAATAPNDNFANATVISALPFSDVVDNTSATTEPGEPTGGCFAPQQTVWYSITPASNMTIRVDMSGSKFFDFSFDVYEQLGSGFAGLSPAVACDSFANGGTSAPFQASAGKTYYIQAGNSCCTSGGSLHLSVSEVLPPADDNFANATVIPPSQLPFTDTEDPGAATIEAAEPSCIQNIASSWWYSFTPTSTESFTATTGDFSDNLGVYTGSALSNLNQIGCAVNSVLTFRAIAGTTYYLQVGDNGQDDTGPATLTLDHAPPPAVSFSDEPGDPSIFDTLEFFDESSDPGLAGIQSEAWNFGDGATGTGHGPTHQYAADGDYTVTLTITTTDGRTASASQIVHVSTHDVGITTLTVPARAKVDKTSPITVAVTNKRYPETVQVQLLTSNSQGGFDVVGTLTLSVPVKSGKKTTLFAFSYTFTSSDAVVGKVTFEAIATIQGARDAFPNDNTTVATTIIR